MSAHGVRNEIGRLCDFLLARGLALDANGAVVRQRARVKTVTWPTGSATPFRVTPESASTLAEYRQHLSERQFVGLLDDGAVLQLTYWYDADVLVKHRLCYYPCPLDIPWDEMPEDLTVVDWFDAYVEEEGRFLSSTKRSPEGHVPFEGSFRLKGPLRFDYDRAATADGHPSSHLHLSTRECRIPVFGPLSVGHFVRFVFRHFYPAVYSAHAELREWPCNIDSRSLTVGEMQEIHVNCHFTPTTP